MTTNRIQKGSFQGAKEGTGSLHRIPLATPVRARKKSPLTCTPAEKAPARKRVPVVEDPATMIEVKIDVGFGNTLFIRGEGDGLSWDKGKPLLCVDNSSWVWSQQPGRESVTFKLLINDEIWCCGPNLQINAGGRIRIEPRF